MIWRDLILASLQELGVLGQGETGEAADFIEGLDALNGLLDQWAAERLMIYTITRTLTNLVNDQVSYGVGTGGDVDRARPMTIDHVNFIDTTTSPDTEYPLTPLTEDAWSRIIQKAATAPMPQLWYYNPTYPLGTLYLWPIPTLSTLQLATYAPTAVTEVTSISDAVSLPPGYRRMIVKNLAVDLASAYSKKVSPDLYQEAARTKGVVKASNKRLVDLVIENAALGHSGRYLYNINTGS